MACCAKFWLFTFNFLFCLLGLSLIGGGIYFKVVPSDRYSILLENTAPELIYVGIAFGCIIFAISYLACCGALKESKCMLFSFSTIMLMILTAQIGAGIYFAINYNDVIEKGLTESLRGAKYTSLYSFWDELQKDLKPCCGVNGPNDWETIANVTKLPTSCCQTANVECTIDKATTAGCKEKVVQVLLDNKNWIGALFGLVAAIEFLGIVFSCCIMSGERERGRGIRRVHPYYDSLGTRRVQPYYDYD